MIEISLSDSKSMPWISKNGVFVKGYLHFNGKFYSGEELRGFIELLITNFQTIEGELLNFNGSFAFIIQNEDGVRAYVDRVRSIPLYYLRDGFRFILYDQIPATSVVEADEKIIQEFLHTSYTFNENILINNIYILLPGQCLQVSLSSGSWAQSYYYRHIRSEDDSFEIQNSFHNLSVVTENIFSRLIESSQNRQMVVPLSGGYDSRYIVAGLHLLGARNVICYTYGKRDSFEIETALKVSERLGYECHFIEYNDDKWTEMFRSDYFLEYLKHAFNYSAVPHIQDYIAVQYLYENNLIASDAIFIPGFCGDLLGGSYLPVEYLEKRMNDCIYPGIANYILNKHLINRSDDLDSNVRHSILEDINSFISSTEIDVTTEDGFISANECWFTEHKVSKFVVNAVRVFEHFGYEWRLPLWDNEIVEYWYAVPNKYRVDNSLYNDFLFSQVFNAQSIQFRKPTPKSRSRLGKIINQYTPKRVLNASKAIYYYIDGAINSKDINNFDALGSLMLEDLRNNGKSYRTINGILADWILRRVNGGGI